jgi:FAD/FMN-containing dehydrogenase
VCEDGLVIDLASMKGIRVDPARRTAHAQAGLRLGEFDRETQAFGLATTLGVNTDTGIAGLTLAGGYGWQSTDSRATTSCPSTSSPRTAGF